MAEQRVVGERGRGRGQRQREVARGGRRRPAAAQLDELRDRDRDREGRPLPRLEPGAQRAPRRPPGPSPVPRRRPARARRPAARAASSADGDRREQVAPEVGAGPQLARDEVDLELVARSSQPAPADDRGDRRAGEERQHQAEAAVVAARQEAPHERERAGEQDPDRDRLPQQVGDRRTRAQPPGQAGEQQPGVQERALPGRQVVPVADQAVLAGLARPVEVLQRVGDEEAVRAGHDAAARSRPSAAGRRARPAPAPPAPPAPPPRRHPGGGRAPSHPRLGRPGRPAGRPAPAPTRRTRARASSSSRVTGTITRGIDSREPGRSVHGIPVSVMLKPSARAIASVSASNVQPFSPVARYAASAAGARQSLKPQKRSRVGSRSTARQSSTKLRPAIRRRTGWRLPDGRARREPRADDDVVALRQLEHPPERVDRRAAVGVAVQPQRAGGLEHPAPQRAALADVLAGCAARARPGRRATPRGPRSRRCWRCRRRGSRARARARRSWRGAS